MQEDFKNNIIKALSAERFATYSAKQADSAESLIRCLWDIALSKSLYPSLHALEISMRNTIHRNATAAYGDANWYDSVVQAWGKEQLSRARMELVKNGKIETPNRIVAELSFGFWTHLFNAPYENFVRKIIKRAFPNMPKKIRNRNNLKTRLNQLRYLRNRVFHFEPIYNKPYLRKRHAEIMEAIFWIEPDMKTYIGYVDNFEEIHTNGLETIRAKFQAESSRISN